MKLDYYSCDQCGCETKEIIKHGIRIEPPVGQMIINPYIPYYESLGDFCSIDCLSLAINTYLAKLV